MLRFVLKLSLLCWPLVVLWIAELVLPFNQFAFRSWEALAVPRQIVDTPLRRFLPYTALPGPFLPSIELAMVEQGDLGHHTAHAEFRSIAWETDEFGFRVHPSALTPELVIVGDSNAVGTGLSQQDTLAEVLRREHGIESYPYAPADMTAFLGESRFRERPPRYVVIESIERDVLEEFKDVRPTPRVRKMITVHSGALRSAELVLGRVRRLSVLEFIRARINGRPAPIEYDGMLFLKGTDAIVDPHPERVSAAAETLARYADRARERGLRVAVLIVPDKETIYSDVLPGAPVPCLLARLYQALRTRGVEIIDVEAPFLAARHAGLPPYLRDDTHWSPVGVRIGAAEVADWVKRNAASTTQP